MPDMPLFKGGAILKLSCEAKIFSCCHNLHRFFQSEVLRLYFPALEPWVAQSLSLPSGSSQFIHRQMWDHLLRQPPPPAPVLKLPPCHVSTPPQLPSPPILVVWMNVPSLTPWLSDFQTVRFSVSSCFLFLNLLLSFFLVVRGGSVSTYTSILLEVPLFQAFYSSLSHSFQESVMLHCLKTYCV